MSTLKEKAHQLAIHCAAVQERQMSVACEVARAESCQEGQGECDIPCQTNHRPCECNKATADLQGCRECPEFDWEEWDFQHAEDNI